MSCFLVSKLTKNRLPLTKRLSTFSIVIITLSYQLNNETFTDQLIVWLNGRRNISNNWYFLFQWKNDYKFVYKYTVSQLDVRIKPILKLLKTVMYARPDVSFKPLQDLEYWTTICVLTWPELHIKHLKLLTVCWL